MGKDKKEKRRSAGLAEDIVEGRSVKTSKRVKQRERQADEDEQFVADRLSKKILDQAREQQQELEMEFGVGSSASKKQKTPFKDGRTRLGAPSVDDMAEEDSDDDDDNLSLTGEQDYEDIQVDEEDEKALEMFMNKEPPQRRTLADIIMEKIQDKKTEIETQVSEHSFAPEMDERLVKVFKSVGEVLSKYRSGKLPKAFKIIPSLTNWEEVLYLTNPDDWSAAAMFQATRIFVSNLNAKMAQRFFNLVLLPRVRDDIAEYKKLNYHLYMSLKKALFKPAAFFKGVLIPIAESGNCTLREAVILSSVLAKTSIPVLHSSAALLKIAEMEYSGSNSIFIRTLLDKKYALPFRVIDALVFHFLRFMSEKRLLPVLWHQSLLTFVERYKEDISSEQKESLLELCRVQAHGNITDEIRRELVHSQSRDIELDVPMEAV